VTNGYALGTLWGEDDERIPTHHDTPVVLVRLEEGPEVRSLARIRVLDDDKLVSVQHSDERVPLSKPPKRGGGGGRL
jgi:hypothetical protein